MWAEPTKAAFMGETEEIADRIRNALPNVKRGSLRIWGEWFGRPYDNFHTLVRCEEQDYLRLTFHQGETLFVWSPRSLSMNNAKFRIKTAVRVRWEWFYYGRPQVQENLYFMEFEKSSLKITSKTNIDFYKPTLRPSVWRPAVEIV